MNTASPEHSDAAPRVCVVLPSYNNAPTLGDVLDALLEVTPDVIVVDDGSTDGTVDVLRRFPGVAVERHERNRGKGAALATGLARAAELGFTHAITMDADGQHSAADVPKLLAAVAEHPEAIVVGVRDLVGGGARLKSRVLRAHSNFWVLLHTGRWVHDTQSGLRAYPLEPVLELRLKTRRYDFEVEVLVKAMWSGVPVVEVPVSVCYGTASRSHFRPVRDFWWVSHLNGCLLTQRLVLPASLRGVVHRKSFHKEGTLRRAAAVVRGAVLQETGSAGAFAACIGLGVCLGILPIWGFQIAAAVLVAHKLKLSKPLVVAASNISIPVMIPLILWLSLVAGQFALSGRLDFSLAREGVSLITVWAYALEYVIGAVVLAMVAGLAATLVAYVLARVAVAVWRRRHACEKG